MFCSNTNTWKGLTKLHILVGELKSCMVQKCKMFAFELYTAGFLYIDSQNSA